MKQLLIILPLVFCSLSLAAENPTKKDKNTDTKDVNKKADEIKKMELVNDSFYLKEPKLQDTNINFQPSKSVEPKSDTDSSYYSVNKFNYLFYFMYKVNYLMDGEQLP